MDEKKKVRKIFCKFKVLEKLSVKRSIILLIILLLFVNQSQTNQGERSQTFDPAFGELYFEQPHINSLADNLLVDYPPNYLSANSPSNTSPQNYLQTELQVDSRIDSQLDSQKNQNSQKKYIRLNKTMRIKHNTESRNFSENLSIILVAEDFNETIQNTQNSAIQNAGAQSTKQAYPEAEIDAEIGPIKKIKFNNLVLEANNDSNEFSNYELPLGIEELNLTGALQSYAIDPTQLNFTNATVTVTAKDKALYKCPSWNFTGRECTDEKWVFLQDIIPGENYTITLSASDPAFYEASRTVDVSVASLDSTTFVVAFVDPLDSDVSFRVMNTNGSIIVDTTDVDTTADTKSKVSVAAINSSRFVIAYIDGPTTDMTHAIYDRDGSTVLAPNDIDTNVGTFADVEVVELGDSYVVCDQDQGDNDANFYIRNNDGSALVNELEVDVNANPGANLQNLVGCSAINRTKWVYTWFDDGSNTASYRIVDQAGVMITTQINPGGNVGETGQVASATMDEDRFAMAFYNSVGKTISLTIVDRNNNNVTAPTVIDSNAGTDSRISIATVRRNRDSTQDLIAVVWFSQNQSKILAEVFNSTGSNISGQFVVETNQDATYNLLDAVGRDPVTNNSICAGKFIVAYSNLTNVSVFKGFDTNGNSWDGICASPSVTLNAPANNSIFSTNTINFNCSAFSQQGLKNITLYGNWTGTWQANETKSVSGANNSASFTKTLPDGDYTWNCQAYDAEELSIWDNNRTFRIDTTPPAISIISPQNITYNNETILINISVSSDANTTWFFNGTANETYSAPIYKNFEDGNQTIIAYVNDTAGNINSTNVTFRINLSTFPVITFVSPTPPNGTVTSQNYAYINITSTKGLSNATLEWNGINESMNTTGASGTKWFNNKTGLATAVYTYRVFGTDTTGRTNASETRTLIVDNAPNITSINITPQQPYTLDNLNLSVICTDIDGNFSNLTGYWQWYRNGTLQSSLSGSSAVTNGTLTTINVLGHLNTTKHDNWTAEVFCSDSLLNSSRTNASVIILNSQPTIASVNLTPASIFTNDNITCTVFGTNDNDTEAVQYYYNWYNNSQLKATFLLSTNTSILNYTFTAKNENWTCNVTPYDGEANGTSRVSSTLTILNTPPTAPTVLTPLNGRFGGVNGEAIIPINCSNSTDADFDAVNFTIEANYDIASWSVLESNADGIFQWNISDLISQTVDLRCRALDGTNVSDYFNPAGNITIDNTEPMITIVSPLEIAYNSTTILFNITLNENASWCAYSLDSGADINMQNITFTNWFAQNTSMSQREHTVSFSCNDTLGNLVTGITSTFVVDTFAPALYLESPANNTIEEVSNSIIFKYNTTDATSNVTNCTLYINQILNETKTTVAQNRSQNFTKTIANANSNYNWSISCYDSAGLINASQARTINISVFPLNITLNAPPDNFLTSNSTATFNCSATGTTNLANISLYGNWTGVWQANETRNVTGVNNSASFTKTFADGVYTWNCQATNNASISRFSVQNRTFRIDTAPPAITIISPQNRTYNTTSILINISVSSAINDANTTWFFNGTANETYRTPIYKNFSEGNHTITAYANDTTGNTNSTNVTFTIDITPPTVTNITLSRTVLNQSQSTNLTVITNDASSVANVVAQLTSPNSIAVNNTMTFFGGSTFSIVLNTTTDSIPGTYSITIFAYDSVGNVNNTGKANFTLLDVTPPSFNTSNTMPQPNSQFNQTSIITISASPSENSTVTATITWDSAVQAINLTFNGTNNGTNLRYNSTFSNTTFPGLYNVSINATDAGGNTNITATNFTILDITAPAVLNIQPTAGTAFNRSQAFNITVNVTDSYFDSVQAVIAEIKHPNNSSTNYSLSEIGNTQIFVVLFNDTNQTGVYNITIIANDTFGNRNSTEKSYFVINESANVTDTALPNITAYFINPYDPIIGSNISINATATDNVDVSSIFANITLPNGTITTIPVPSVFSPSIIGRYNVTFLAYDTSNNIANASDFFIAGNLSIPVQFNTITPNGSGAYLNLSIFFAGTDKKVAEINFTGNSIRNSTNVLYDLRFTAINESISVRLNSVNFSRDSNSTIGLDRMPSVFGFLVVYGIHNNYTISNATVTVSYNSTSFTNDDFLNVFKCALWNFTSQTCYGSWANFSGAVQNKSIRHFRIETSNFSAYSIQQGSYCGDNVCDSNETCDSCSSDCGVCAPGGGNGGGGATSANLSTAAPKKTAEAINESVPSTAIPPPPANITEVAEEFTFSLTSKLVKSTIAPGEYVSASLSITNFGSGSARVMLIYTVYDESNTAILSQEEEKNVENTIEFAKDFKLPEEIIEGEYKFTATLVYQEQVVVAENPFTIAEGGGVTPTGLAVLAPGELAPFKIECGWLVFFLLAIVAVSLFAFKDGNKWFIFLLTISLALTFGYFYILLNKNLCGIFSIFLEAFAVIILLSLILQEVHRYSGVDITQSVKQRLTSFFITTERRFGLTRLRAMAIERRKLAEERKARAVRAERARQFEEGIWAREPLEKLKALYHTQENERKIHRHAEHQTEHQITRPAMRPLTESRQTLPIKQKQAMKEQTRKESQVANEQNRKPGRNKKTPADKFKELYR